MTGTIFRRSIGIGLGFGFSVAIFYWLTSDLPAEPHTKSSTSQGYASLEQLAKSWAQAEGVPSKIDPHHSHDFDTPPQIDSTRLNDTHDTLQRNDNRRSNLSNRSNVDPLPPQVNLDEIHLDESNLAGELVDASRTSSVTSNGAHQAAEPASIAKVTDPILAQTETESLSSAYRDNPAPAETGESDRVSKKPEPHFSPIRSPGIHGNPFFSEQTARTQHTDSVPPAHSNRRSDSPSLPPSDDERSFDLDWSTNQANPNRTSDETFERTIAEPLRFANSDARPNRQANSVLVDSPSLKTVSAPNRFSNFDAGLSESAALRAVHHIEYGKTLARRGALATAEQEFNAALSVLARDFDARTGNNQHSLALAKGMQALKEAGDFAAGNLASQIDLDVAGISESHQSGALSPSMARQLSAVQALQQYLSYAQFQIEQGAGRNVVAAEALYCLGKLRTINPATVSKSGNLNAACAIVFHRTALAGDPNNHRSAHELGVLMAHLGELDQSRELFKQSLRIQPTPKAWENLAKLHQRMNEPQLAQLAQIEHQKAIDQLNSGPIRWVESPQFQAQALPENLPSQMAKYPSTNNGNATGNRSLRTADASSQGKDGKQKNWTERIKFW